MDISPLVKWEGRSFFTSSRSVGTAHTHAHSLGDRDDERDHGQFALSFRVDDSSDVDDGVIHEEGSAVSLGFIFFLFSSITLVRATFIRWSAQRQKDIVQSRPVQ